MKLTEKQSQAIDKFRAWTQVPGADPFLLQGYAGTGKTTLVKYLLDQIDADHVALAAPTGKAARVLSRMTGKRATTIHKLLYTPQNEELRKLQDRLAQLHTDAELADDPTELDLLIAKTEEEIKALEGGDLRFFFKGAEGLQLLIIDEGPMVRDTMMKDIMSIGCPVMFVGDPGQLPPVKGKSAWDSYDPNVILTEIVRTKGKASGINLAAQSIRFGERPVDGEGFKLHPRGALGWKEYSEADVVLCGTNRLRRSINLGLRSFLGIDDPMPQEGERVICLGNNARFDIVNGELLELKKLIYSDRRIWEGWFESDDGSPKRIRFWSPLFKDDQQTDIVPTGIAALTHARAITVHKMQGSQDNRIIVCDDWPGIHHTRWLYTGVTRAIEHCDLVAGV